MKNNKIISQETNSKLIRVNFRKGKLSIDSDSYLDRVSEVHCRSCSRRTPRSDATELDETWGYICNACQTTLSTLRNILPFKSSSERRQRG